MLSKAYIVPHPPIILPEIGRGQERAIQNTVNVYRMITHGIVSAEPQTIIMFSPHASSYRDYIQMSDSAQAFSGLEVLDMKNVDIKVLYGEDFADMLCHVAASRGLSTDTLGEQS